MDEDENLKLIDFGLCTQQKVLRFFHLCALFCGFDVDFLVDLTISPSLNTCNKRACHLDFETFSFILIYDLGNVK